MASTIHTGLHSYVVVLFGVSDAGITILLFLYSILKLVTIGGLFDNFPRTLKSAF